MVLSYADMLAMGQELSRFCPVCAEPLKLEPVEVMPGHSTLSLSCPTGHGKMHTIGLGNGPALAFIVSASTEQEYEERAKTREC